LTSPAHTSVRIEACLIFGVKKYKTFWEKFKSAKLFFRHLITICPTNAAGAVITRTENPAGLMACFIESFEKSRAEMFCSLINRRVMRRGTGI